MVSFSLRQRISLPPPRGPAPVSFHLSQFGRNQFTGFDIYFQTDENNIPPGVADY